jgi:uncharacterized protein (DUF924 family)
MTAKPDNSMAAGIETLLDSWFDADVANAEAMNSQMRRWFASSADEDRELAARYGELARAAADGRLDDSAATPRGRLGLIILLDQFPRNLHRGSAAAFAQDARALALCLSGIELGMPERLAPIERVFFLMPMQHAEDPAIQTQSVERFAALATADGPPSLLAALRACADYAVMHRKIVDRFGRFPHRNRALDRESTAAEREFLETGGPSFGQ